MSAPAEIRVLVPRNWFWKFIKKLLTVSKLYYFGLKMLRVRNYPEHFVLYIAKI